MKYSVFFPSIFFFAMSTPFVSSCQEDETSPSGDDTDTIVDVDPDLILQWAKLFLLFTFFTFSLSVSAHDGGHGHEHTTRWIVDNDTIEATFLKLVAGKVFLETKSGEISIHQLGSFSAKDQQRIRQKVAYIEALNQGATEVALHNHDTWIDVSSRKSQVLTGLLVISAFLFFILKRKKQRIANTLLFLSLLVLLACDEDDTTSDTDTPDTPSSVPANDVAALASIFGQFSNVTTSSDDTYFYVSSTGIPEHDMMVGITNWQQQVPIPHDYSGANSWAFPIQPVLADTPLLSSEHFMRGAIAIAVNGIPIFNPLNNRGEDALAIGELDDWGGHCGRADDYHYHVPPTHLKSTVGADQPIAYALDGFPIYGETADELDEYLGKFNEDGSYQYHTTNEHPYFIAGMRGEVTLDPNTTAPEDQILPQAMTREVRPALTPLPGAEIVSFTSTGTNAYSLEYQIGTEVYYTNYSWDENGLYTYEYVDSEGNVTTETYQR
ncbi:YHYH protein [Tunicatimonas pelagia]|uniref:YHYH protein n=1 Tax=Tunicatimonas pelagia TaxID=931531 RepID=UPI0026667B05|nr:YHYH protein [Tunicatimonas pelagia]WKN42751.1 YHYH protein [Tunicatimonas pelagia]